MQSVSVEQSVSSHEPVRDTMAPCDAAFVVRRGARRTVRRGTPWVV